ncbi:MAG: PqiC family protein [Thermodesulfobacteriota bacterium]|nr:PqiC family protein [Thermodesulfobacteriota bacterium]
MQNSPVFKFLILTTIISLLFTGGCSTSTPSNFFILTPLSSYGIKPVQRGHDQKFTLGIGPVTIPRHLDRPQIVVRISPNEIKLADFHRWAGSLAHEIPSVLSENLSILLATDRITLYPWQSSMHVNFQIFVDIIQLDGKLGDSITLIARWRILNQDENKMLVIKKTKVTKTLKADNYQAFVAAESSALADLCREIAQAVKTIMNYEL